MCCRKRKRKKSVIQLARLLLCWLEQNWCCTNIFHNLQFNCAVIALNLLAGNRARVGKHFQMLNKVSVHHWLRCQSQSASAGWPAGEDQNLKHSVCILTSNLPKMCVCVCCDMVPLHERYLAPPGTSYQECEECVMVLVCWNHSIA